MKSEDLFEILTDIDDNMIYKAKAAQLKDSKTEEEYAEPTFITVTKKKFPWKAAACAAMAVVVAASAGAVILRNGNISLFTQQGGADIAFNSAEYPPEAKYVYKGDFSELTHEVACEIDRKAYDLYDPMERDSDLVVYGTFTDDAHQIFDPEDVPMFSSPGQYLYSYNKFKVDKIFKGDGTVKEGDEIIIAQNYAVFTSRLMTGSGLTPMLKGDEWFYCLTKSGDSNVYYYATGDTDGRYSSFDSTALHDYTCSFEVPGIYDNSYYKQNIHELVYERYLNEKFTPDVRNIVNYLDETPNDMFESTKAFEIPEFPGVYFVWSADVLKEVKGDEETVLYGGMPIWDLHLADLNGDGKRELCSTVSIGSGIVDDHIIAVDYANSEIYELSDRGTYDYRISVEVTAEQNRSHEQQGLFYIREKYNSRGSTVSDGEGGILTLDIMKKIGDTEITFYNPDKILDLNSGGNVGWNDTYTFTMDEFPEVVFKWSSEKLEVSANGKNFVLYDGMPVWTVYLFDLNGDGKREICSDISDGSGMIDDHIIVFDYENGECYELSDRGNYDYTIDWTRTQLSSDLRDLYYSVRLYNDKEIIESKPLSLDIMKKISTVVISSENIDASSYVINGGADEGARTTASLEQTNEFGGEEGEKINSEYFKIYEQFGMTYEGEKKGLYFNGKKVRWFEDYYPIDEEGNQAGMDYINETGIVDVYAVRDLSNLTHYPDGSFDPSGKLIGLKEFSEEEFAARDIKAILDSKEVTHVAYDYGDLVATFETDSENRQIQITGTSGTDAAVKEGDSTVEATTNVILNAEDMRKAREEHLKMEEEYKPFGVTYDEKEEQWYFNGEKVRYFRDILTSNGESLTGGKFSGSMRTMSGKGTVDIYTVRDFSRPDKEGIGKLTGIKAFEDGVNPYAIMIES